MDQKAKLGRFILLGLLLILAVVGWHFYEHFLFTLIKGREECDHETPIERDIMELSQNLYNLETQTSVPCLAHVDYQGRTTLHNSDDQAPFLLFPRIGDCAGGNNSSTVHLLSRLYNNYDLDTHIREKITAEKKQEEFNFLRAILKTPIMRRTMKFLQSKAAVAADDDDVQLRLLQDIWFTQYSRGGVVVGSSGFEHVFLAELMGSTPEGMHYSVLGLHNWIYFREQEWQGNLNYEGLIENVELNKHCQQYVAVVRFRFHNIVKPYNTIFIGTSPELEISLYTICFVLHPNQPCPVQLGHSKLIIFTYSRNWKGKQVIVAAYPSINFD